MGYKSKYTGAEIDEAIERIPRERRIIHDAGFNKSTIATADGIFDEFHGVGYVVPESRSFIEGNYDEVLATQSYVDEHIPTEIATAPQKELITLAPSKNKYMANVVYEWQGSPNTIDIDALEGGDDAHDSVWTIRFGCSSATTINIAPSVLWKDGKRPAVTEWCVCELTFKKQSELLGNYLGEWKIYK